MLKLLRKEKGVTLIALIVTIIVLLILAGISISALTGDNSIINNANSARNNSDISKEKEIVELSAVQAMGKNRLGLLKKETFENTLSVNSNNGTNLDENEEDEMFIVTFIKSQRVYNVNSDGNVDFLGDMEKVKNSATISADPASNTTPRAVQKVNLLITTIVGLESDEVFVRYAWTDNKDTTPSTYKSLNYTTSTSKKRREASVNTEGGPAGDYYLWVQVDINGTLNTKQFGPYTVLENNPLIATSSEKNATSSFLNSTSKQNKNITMTRAEVESVTITNDISGHSLEDSNCWDVSNAQNGTILAWYEKDGDYYKVTIGANGGVVANPSSQYLFSNIGSNGNEGAIKIDGLEYLDTSLVTNMSYMFIGCTNVKNIDVGSFSTSNVTTMSRMFSGCSDIVDLNLSSFSTGNVTDTVQMFFNCTSLKNIIFSNKFDTSKVTSMEWMFMNCLSLTSLDLNHFNTRNVQFMGLMFSGCTNLSSLNIKNFDTRNVKKMHSMFNGCSSLETLEINTSTDLATWDVSNVQNFDNTFCNCSKLKNLDLSRWDTKSATSMYLMFSGCSALENINISKFDTKKVTQMGFMFSGCTNLNSLDLTNWETENVNSFRAFVANCTSLKNLNITKSNFKTNNCNNMDMMFHNCQSLSNLDVSGFDTSNVTNMNLMFNNCQSLTSIDVSKFNTSNVTSMPGMFDGCTNLLTLDVDSFDISKATNISRFFSNCTNLTTIYCNKDWKTNAASGVNNVVLFANDSSLVGAVPFSAATGNTINLANPTTGYFTYKNN